MNTVEPSRDCVERITKLRNVIKVKDIKIKEAISMAANAEQNAKVAFERQKAAETTLSSAIEKYNGDDSGGREEDFGLKLEPRS